MIKWEQDSDVVQWGLQLFESDPYANCVYYDAAPQNNTDYWYQDEEDGDAQLAHWTGEGFDAECFSVENDELIAHSLLEELSQLAIAEQSGGEGRLEQNVEADCCGQEKYGGRVEADDAVPSSPCSTPQEGSSEWQLYSSELMDELAFDGKWLDEMVPIPHVPKINGEIPSVDEATLDHQRLLDRLQVYDLVERKVQGDGNCQIAACKKHAIMEDRFRQFLDFLCIVGCWVLILAWSLKQSSHMTSYQQCFQFRALSDQFYRTSEHHEFVRQQVVNQLRSYPEIYEGCVPMDYDEYLEKMSRSGEWGDHVTLQSAADSYGVKIIVITSFKDTCYIEILPSIQRSKRVILLSFWAEVHYNSIFPQGDVHSYVTRKKKKGRILRNKHLEIPDECN